MAEEVSKHGESPRMGKAVEHLVAASCILASRAKLNVSTTLVDDEGVDLVFHRRDGTATLAVQVKARMSDSKQFQAGRFTAVVRQQTFRERDDLYMLFVPTEVPEGTFKFVWFVPSRVFRNGAQVVKTQGRLRFAASMKPESRDKWSGFRVERRDLPGKILAVLEELDLDD